MMIAFLTVCILLLLLAISFLLGIIRRLNGVRSVFESMVYVYEKFTENIRDDESLDNSTLTLCMENALKYCINNQIINIEMIREMLTIQYGHKDLLDETSDAEAIKSFAIMMSKINKNHLAKGE
jgi:hypothetical protein